MQCDTDSLAERIIRDIEAVYVRDDRLAEFQIIPEIFNQNKSPVIHEQNNLGLESWCVKHVFNYAQQRILESKHSVAKRKLLFEEYDNVNRLLIAGLLINPDVTTFWNMRRELISDKFLDLKKELKFSKLVLSHKPKSNEAFGYRRFILKRILAEKIDKESIRCILSSELIVCQIASEKASNNYHACNHKIWCMENILTHPLCDDVREEIFQSEISANESWVIRHISEHTGFHYRQYIFNNSKKVNLNFSDSYQISLQSKFNFSLDNKTCSTVLKDLFGPQIFLWGDKDLKSMYQNTILLLGDLMHNNVIKLMYLDHEAIWYHRRSILYHLFLNMHVYLGLQMYKPKNLDLLCAIDNRENNIVLNEFDVEKGPKLIKSEKYLIQNTKLYKELVKHEKKLIFEHSQYLTWEAHLAKQHGKWLTYILGVPNL